jgi:REP element-mobilizing transposase RayT
MARPIRIEYPGALYHVTARGDRRGAIYADDEDREAFLETLGQVVTDFNWICYAYCLMTNHYHLVIETPDANLSKGMRQLNGVFTQYGNRRHGLKGHLFQWGYRWASWDCVPHGTFYSDLNFDRGTCYASRRTESTDLLGLRRAGKLA